MQLLQVVSSRRNRFKNRPRTPPGVHPTQFFIPGPFLRGPRPRERPPGADIYEKPGTTKTKTARKVALLFQGSVETLKPRLPPPPPYSSAPRCYVRRRCAAIGHGAPSPPGSVPWRARAAFAPRGVPASAPSCCAAVGGQNSWALLWGPRVFFRPLEGCFGPREPHGRLRRSGKPWDGSDIQAAFDPKSGPVERVHKFCPSIAPRGFYYQQMSIPDIQASCAIHDGRLV